MARVSGESRFLKVTCPFGAFRRAGLAFGKEPVFLNLDDLTDQQIEALGDELRLEIEELDELPEGVASGDADELVDPAEVAVLRGEVATLTTDLQQAIADRDAALKKFEEADKDASELAFKNATLTSELESMTRERDAAELRIVELTATPVEPEGSEKSTSKAKAKAKAKAPADTSSQ